MSKHVYRTILTFIPLLILATLGSGLIAESFAVAASGNNHDLMFAIFWAGMLTATLPLVFWLSRRNATVTERTMSIIGLALVTTLPKILRSPFGPLFHDEYAHLRATQDILNTGLPGGFNSLVTPVPQFPGLHAVTAWISLITGFNSWTSGLALIVVAHIAGLLGIYVLVRTLGISTRGAAIGATVYATNANWMYFHSQFGYESLGLPLVIWTIILAIYAIRAARPRRYGFLLAIAPISYALASIHHLSALSMIGILGLIAIYCTFHSIRIKTYKYALMSWSVLIVAATFVYIRLIPTIQLLTDYLGSPITHSTKNLISKVSELFGLSESNGSTRVLFEGGNLPTYERVLSFGATLIIGLAVAFVIYIWISKRWRWLPQLRTFNIPKGSPIRNAFLALSLMYILSVPFILSASGAESARRSWGYSFIGVAVLFGLIVDILQSRIPETNNKRSRAHASITIGFSSLFVVLLIGGVAAGVNEGYRFPEPVTKINDIVASTAEAKEVGQWFADNTKPNTWVMADRYSGMQVASTGRDLVAPPSGAFPYWKFYYSFNVPDVSLVAEMKAINVQYIVVDKRMLTDYPELGFWLATGEPRDPNGQLQPYANAGAFDKFDYLPWMTKVFTTENYSIYKFNLDLYNPYQTKQIIQEHNNAATSNY